MFFCVCRSPAPVSEGASTIHLPVKDCHIAEGTNCTMYGWGETKSTAFFHPHAMSLCILTSTQSPKKKEYVQHLTTPCMCTCISLTLFRYRTRWDAECGDHAYGEQWHVLTDQRGRRGKQDMCRRQERGRRVWCKGHTYCKYDAMI